MGVNPNPMQTPPPLRRAPKAWSGMLSFVFQTTPKLLLEARRQRLLLRRMRH